MLTLLLTACVPPAAVALPTESTWTGAASATLHMGVESGPEGWSAYLCVGGDERAMSSWLSGGWDDRVVHLEGGDWVADLLLDDAGHLSGVLLDRVGAPTPLDLQGAAAPDGVWSTEEGDCRSGAILAGGELTGTWCDGAGTYAQVEPVDTLTPDPEGRLWVQARTASGNVVLPMVRVGGLP